MSFSAELVREGEAPIALADPEVLNTEETYLLVRGADGLDLPDPDMSTSPIPGRHGVQIESIALRARDMFLPVLVNTESRADYWAARDRLLAYVSPVDPRPLFLRTHRSGREGWRQLQVHYAGGMDGSSEDHFDAWGKVGLKLRSGDGFWSGEPVTITQKITTTSTYGFLNSTVPFFPARFSDATIAGTVALQVFGDAETFPTIRVSGPGTGLTIKTPGATFELTGELGTETITLDCLTGSLTGTQHTPEELWARVPLTSRIPRLVPGRTEWTVSLVNANADSEVSVSWAPQYLGGQ